MKNTKRTTLYAKRYTLYAILVILFCTILPQAKALAATYYCDPVKGDTTIGDGSSENPWGTLQSIKEAGYLGTYAPWKEGKVKSGDTVKLKTGFHGKFEVWKFTPTDYITIEADTDAVADISLIRLKYSSYWRFKGLRISPSFDTNIPLSPWPCSVVIGSDLREYFCIKSHTSDVTNRPVTGANYATYWVWTGNPNGTKETWQSGASYTYSAQNQIINGWLGNKNITIEDCNIFSIADSSSWNANQWYYLAWTGIRGDFDANCVFRGNHLKNISTIMSVGGGLIEQNQIDGFCGEGIMSGTDSTIQDNYIVNLYDDNSVNVHVDMIHISGNNIIVRRNYLCVTTDPDRPSKAASQGIYQSGAHPLTNSLIENNVVIVTNRVWGITFGDYSDNVKILNNTLLRPYNYGYWPAITGKSTSTNILIRNNIARAFPTDDPSRNIVSDHNFDITNYNPDVEFVDYAQGNVHLAANSHFIDAGSAADAPNEDLDRNSRPQGQGYDVGAYEYGASTFLYGDVNSDGEISAYDAALAAHIAVDLEHPDIKNPQAAEVSGDGQVTAYDAALIAQRAVGLIEKFPVE